MRFAPPRRAANAAEPTNPSSASTNATVRGNSHAQTYSHTFHRSRLDRDCRRAGLVTNQRHPLGHGPAGSSGGKALVVLANILNKAMPEYRITVLPTPGAVGTVKGFAMGEFDGYYGSDVALEEFAADSGRFKGFKATMKRTPVQSLWTYTLDCGLAIKASDADTIKKWADLTGKKVYTGPVPFDTRLKAENALHDLGVKHIYKEVALDRRLAAQ